MADPLSIVAVITGVVTLADEVFTRTFVYVKAVKHGEEERAKLNLEIGALFGILSRLRLLSCAMKGKEGEKSYEPGLQTHQLNSCRDTLEKIKSKIEAYEGAGRATGRRAVRTALKPLRWPFTSSEVQCLLSEMKRHKANLSLALAADELSKLVHILSTQERIYEALHSIQSKQDRTALTDRRRHILDSFGSIDPRKNHDMSGKLWHPSTGLWLTNGRKFQGWLTDRTAKNIWCYGIPGSGKTVLASAVIDEIQERCSESVAAAYFYCDYKDVETQDPANILGSLAYQLIRQSDACFEKAKAFYDVRHSRKHVSTSYSPTELRDFILQMCSVFDRTMKWSMVLMNAVRNTIIVVELLSSLGKSDISSVQTLFLSRDEIEIRETLTDYTPLSIAASKADIYLYVTAELATRMQRLHIKNKPLVDLITDRLVDGANEM